MSLRLRPYQQEAVASTLEAFKDVPSALGVAATGMGKTIIFAHLVKHFTAHGKRAMVIAHREELINQAAAKIQAVAGIQCDIEMASKHADVGMFNRSPVVVASVQTLATGRLNKFNPDDFGLIVIDEAHHAVAKSYQRPIDHILSNPKAKAFGVTATPDRTDELALGRVFDRAAFDYDIDFGVSESWLVPIKARSIPVDGLDFSQIRSTCGDLNESELAALMEAEGPLHEIADPTVQLVGDRKALVFAVSVRHAELLAEIFNRHKEGCARWVCGATPKMERQQIIADFAARRFQYLVNVGVFTEGFDDPTIDVVVMGRPTESRALFAQMVGRGTRPIPHARIDDYPNDTRQRAASIAASSKPSVEILDFVANAGNHQLVSVGDLLGGDYDSEIVAKVKQRQETEAVDFREACEEAVAEKKAMEEARILADRERRRQLIAKADFQVIELDPFDVLGLRPIRRREWDRGKPLSTPMLEKLRREGVPNPEQLSYAAARRLVHETFARKYKGAPSYRQSAALKYVGLNVPGTAAEAGRMIERVKRGEAVPT